MSAVETSIPRRKLVYLVVDFVPDSEMPYLKIVDLFDDAALARGQRGELGQKFQPRIHHHLRIAISNFIEVLP
jgi:hypothetical protein